MLEQIFNLVKEVFSDYIDVDQLDLDSPFNSLNIDSLVLVELAIMLNERLSIVVVEFEIIQGNSIRRLIELCEGRRNASLVSDESILT